MAEGLTIYGFNVDALTEVSILGLATAAAAGAVSFVSPCVLPLVPGYLSFVSAGADAGRGRPRRGLAVAWPAAWFVAGFTTVFVLLGLGAQFLGGLVARYSTEASVAGGILVIAFGLVMTGALRLPFLMRDVRHLGPRDVTGVGSAYLLGLAFAFGWTPCIGPVLGAILTVAATSAGSGAVLLAAYGLGLGLPFMAVALVFGNAAAGLGRARRAGAALNFAAGVTMIVMGLLMATGRLQVLAFWLLERFPALGQVG